LFIPCWRLNHLVSLDKFSSCGIFFIRARKGSFKNQNYLMSGKISAYFTQTKEELIRVSWPGKNTVIKHTLLVVGISLGVAILLGGADFLFTYGLTKLITR
jgi:preprotein translocase SecE subunit